MPSIIIIFSRFGFDKIINDLLSHNKMIDHRIYNHPILSIEKTEEVIFYWEGKPIKGKLGEPISSALIANGIFIFNHHVKDHAPQSIYCANGQCAQCMVIVNGVSAKACITPVVPGIKVNPINGLISLPDNQSIGQFKEIEQLNIPVLIIGGGPAGLSAALEFAQQEISVLVVDDKKVLGGKLILQTHRFFGSTKTVYAGTRGYQIAQKLISELSKYESVKAWVNSIALGVFSDKKIGILKNGNQYILIKPDHLIIACGAREKSLMFPGNTLPGVLGAGAFQTLLNRDMVYPGRKVIIIGGGNVGLITGYHAIQAGIEVVGLVEVMPECGGYKVHADHLRRLGVPIYVSHTILQANGKNHVESVTISRVNENFEVIPGTEKTITCDCILVAAGLDPVKELYEKAKEFEFQVEAAGDAENIAEASAAMISGKIKAKKIIQKIKGDFAYNENQLIIQKDILASKPGIIHDYKLISNAQKIFPVIHCLQEIPCDPCSVLCPFGLIRIDANDICKIPEFLPLGKECSGCLSCVAGCPGHAITLVENIYDQDSSLVSMSYEFNNEQIKLNDILSIVNINGEHLCYAPVEKIINKKAFNSTKLISVKLPKEKALKAAGYRFQKPSSLQETFEYLPRDELDNLICRCERVSKKEIIKLVRSGITDLNEIKAITRAGMGACGGKTCQNLILQLMKQEGLNLIGIIPQTNRPLFCETPLSHFAGINNSDSNLKSIE